MHFTRQYLMYLIMIHLDSASSQFALSLSQLFFFFLIGAQQKNEIKNKKKLLAPIARTLMHYVWHRSENKRQHSAAPSAPLAYPRDIVYLVYVLVGSPRSWPSCLLFCSFPRRIPRAARRRRPCARPDLIPARCLYFTPSNCQSAVVLVYNERRRRRRGVGGCDTCSGVRPGGGEIQIERRCDSPPPHTLFLSLPSGGTGCYFQSVTR